MFFTGVWLIAIGVILVGGSYLIPMEQTNSYGSARHFHITKTTTVMTGWIPAEHNSRLPPIYSSGTMEYGSGFLTHERYWQLIMRVGSYDYSIGLYQKVPPAPLIMPSSRPSP